MALTITDRLIHSADTPHAPELVSQADADAWRRHETTAQSAALPFRAPEAQAEAEKG